MEKPYETDLILEKYFSVSNKLKVVAIDFGIKINFE